MTLVVAKRHPDFAWMIADTYSEIPARNEVLHPFENPTPKIVRIRDWAVGFAGSVDSALNALQGIEGDDAADAVATLLAKNRATLDSPASVDFIALNVATFELTRVMRGNAERVDTAFLGSSVAASAYQRNRHEPPPDDPSLFGLNMINVPDGVAKEFVDEFSNGMGAFLRTVRESNVECGGYAVPFYASKGWTGYPFYTSASRGPISSEETTHMGHTTSVYDDEIGGGFTFNFWGGPNGFGVYFERPELGQLYLGIARSGLTIETLRGVDPFEFSERAESESLGGMIGKNWEGALQRAVRLIEEGEFDRAKVLIDFVRQQIEGHLKSQNGERTFDISDSVINAFIDAGEAAFTVVTANMITGYLAVSEHYFAITKNDEARKKTLKERRSWQEVIEMGKVRLKFEAKPPASNFK
jgi:hypothetical protein